MKNELLLTEMTDAEILRTSEQSVTPKVRHEAEAANGPSLSFLSLIGQAMALRVFPW